MIKIFVFIICIYFPGYSQQNNGYALYKFTYPTINGQQVLNASLQFNDSISLFTYYRYGMDDDSKTKQDVSVKDNKQMHITVGRYDKTGEQIYRDFRTGTIRHRFTKVPPHDAYLVHDNWIKINWVISGEYKNIAGYNCQKATATFRGRTYTAWFTTQIPLPYGPWKLFGLPGLILEAADNKGDVVFTIKSVCYPCNTESVIQVPDEKEIKTIQEHVAFRDYYMESIEKTIRQKLPKGASFTLDNKTTNTQIKNKRNLSPEIIYEWETPDPERNKIILPNPAVKD